MRTSRAPTCLARATAPGNAPHHQPHQQVTAGSCHAFEEETADFEAIHGRYVNINTGAVEVVLRCDCQRLGAGGGSDNEVALRREQQVEHREHGLVVIDG